MASINIHQFSAAELQIADSVGAVTAFQGAFTTPAGVKALTCLVYVAGTEGIYLLFGTNPVTALNELGGAPGTQIMYIPPGIPMVVGKGAVANFSCITDTGTSKVYLMAGSGS